MQKYTVAFMFNNELDYVALVQKEKPAWQKGKLNGIGGKVEEGETFEHANAREFWEETGVNTQESDWSHFAQITTPNVDIAFFTMASQLAFNVLTPEGSKEDVRTYWLQGLGHSFMSPTLAVENLGWLVFLARDHLQDKRPTFARIEYETADTVRGATHEPHEPPPSLVDQMHDERD